MFSQVCVKNSAQGMCVAKGSRRGEGGMCDEGGICGGGACMAGGMCVGGTHMVGGCVARETATVADGTYPTGMHSCLRSASVY